jgi:hypothetical protein
MAAARAKRPADPTGSLTMGWVAGQLAGGPALSRSGSLQGSAGTRSLGRPGVIKTKVQLPDEPASRFAKDNRNGTTASTSKC